MPEQFKHITVTAAEEDDEVIVAGASTEASSAPGESGATKRSAPDGSKSSEIGATVGADEEPAAVSQAQGATSARSSDTASGKAEGAIGARKPPRKPEEAYREPTLEDLDAGGMSLTQRIVIIAAVVCIIGAIVYYFVAMR